MSSDCLYCLLEDDAYYGDSGFSVCEFTWIGSVEVIDMFLVFFFKQKTAYEVRISDWSSDVCSSDLPVEVMRHRPGPVAGNVRQPRRPGNRRGILVSAATERNQQSDGDDTAVRATVQGRARTSRSSRPVPSRPSPRSSPGRSSRAPHKR